MPTQRPFFTLALLLSLTVAGLACQSRHTPTPVPTATLPRVPTFTPHITYATVLPSPSHALPTLPASPIGTQVAAASPTGVPAVRPATATPRRDELIICMAQEPDNLFLWGGTGTPAKRALLHALYGPGAVTDGIASFRGFSYQPTILAKLPNLRDGDARLTNVPVRPGDPIVDQDSGALQLYRGAPTDMPQLRVTFRIRQRLYWSDSTPVTARDSLFAYRVARDPHSGYPYRDLLDRTAGYVALDDYTLQWTGLPGYVPDTYFLNFFPPLPQHVLKNLSPGDISISDFARRPLGYGPFAMEEWVRGQHIALFRNPFYWKANHGQPYVQRLVFRFPIVADQTLSLLLDGKCDIMTNDVLPPDLYPAILAAQKQGVLQAAIVPDTSWEEIAFNLQPAGGRVPLGAQKALRQAVAYGFNRQAVVTQVWAGQGLVMNSLVLPDHPDYPTSGMRTYPYDPQKARDLLDQAGWRDEDGDGLREAHGVRVVVRASAQVTHTVSITEGTPLSLTLLITSGNPLRHSVAESFQHDMQALGIGIAISAVPPATLFADGPEGALFGRRFDLAEIAWSLPPGPMPPGNLYLCDAIPAEANGWIGNNATGYCNPAYDDAIRSARQTTDEMEKKNYWQQAQVILADDLPALPLFPYLKGVIARPGVTGLQPDSSEPSELYNIDEIRP